MPFPLLIWHKMFAQLSEKQVGLLSAESLPRVNVDVDGKEEEDALEVVLEDGRMQKVSASSVVLLSGQRLDLPPGKFNQPFLWRQYLKARPFFSSEIYFFAFVKQFSFLEPLPKILASQIDTWSIRLAATLFRKVIAAANGESPDLSRIVKSSPDWSNRTPIIAWWPFSIAWCRAVLPSTSYHNSQCITTM